MDVINYLEIGLVIIILLLYATTLYNRKCEERRNLTEVLTGRLTASLRPESSLDQVLAELMQPLSELIPAPGYYFYLYDQKGGALLLRSVKSVATGTITGSVYSDLIKSTTVSYDPPLSLSADSIPRKVTMQKDSKVSILQLPLWSKPAPGDNAPQLPAGMVLIGPLGGVTAEQIRSTDLLATRLGPQVALLNAYHQLRDELDSLETVSQASSKVTGAINIENSFDTFFHLALQLAESDGGVLICPGDKLSKRILYSSDQQLTEELLKDELGIRELLLLADQGKPVLINSKNSCFQQIPVAFRKMNVNALTIFPEKQGVSRVLLVCWYEQQAPLDGHQVASVTLIVQRIAELLGVKLYFEEVSQTYLKSLKTLVESLDRRDPQTVGNSGRVERFAEIIANELNLPPAEVEIITLSAYLRDIGMSGLKQSQLQKKEKFTHGEQDALSVHSEAGYALVQSLPNAEEIALNIKHHHERWDGWGYPDRLKGEQIPLGARVIAVADTFNALISNRPHRPALPFEWAIARVQSAAGSQLDPSLVQLLLDWFAREQATATSGTLEHCWELIQCPESIASKCLAYKNEASCWTVAGTNCAGHDGKCENCLVYTEHQSRQKRVLNKGDKEYHWGV